jgi:hypothetical protein
LPPLVILNEVKNPVRRSLASSRSYFLLDSSLRSE